MLVSALLYIKVIIALLFCIIATYGMIVTMIILYSAIINMLYGKTR